MKPGPQAVDPAERFWRKVDRRGPGECWPWLGGTQGKGYGQFYRRKREPVGAHRFSWELANGRPVPAGMHVMHSCDNPPCVNPAHLRVGTVADNARDCASKGRNPGNRTASGGPSRRVDDAEVARLRAQGLTMREIGEAVGAAPSTILRALRR